MKKAFFIRSAPYDYLVEGLDLFDSFEAVIQKKYNPPLLETGKKTLKENVPNEVFNTKIVYSSSEKRCIDTGKLITKNVITLPLLSEIEYSMYDFIDKENFYKEGKPDVNKARKAFVNGLINNKLQEKYIHVINRIEELMKFILNNDKDNAVYISHGFFLKVIEAYIRDKSIKDNTKRLLEYFDGSHETFKFCEGYQVEIGNNTIKFSTYIKQKE